MATVKQLIARLESLQGKEIDYAAESYKEFEPSIVTYNREQLYAGKNNEGNNLSPSYLDDPYFKTREAAQRYSDWKDRITPNSKRGKGIPNLYINGAFHNTINASVNIASKTIEISSYFYKSSSIESKFTEKIYGLDKENIKNLNEKVQPFFVKKIKEFLQL